MAPVDDTPSVEISPKNKGKPLARPHEQGIELSHVLLREDGISRREDPHSGAIQGVGWVTKSAGSEGRPDRSGASSVPVTRGALVAHTNEGPSPFSHALGCPYDRAMGFLGNFLTGDVLDESEFEHARADGIVLHVRKLKAAIAYDNVPGTGQALQREAGAQLGRSTGHHQPRRPLGRRRPSSWTSRTSLPSPALEVSADAEVLRVSFGPSTSTPDRAGSVEVRLWTPEARRLEGLPPDDVHRAHTVVPPVARSDLEADRPPAWPTYPTPAACSWPATTWLRRLGGDPGGGAAQGGLPGQVRLLHRRRREGRDLEGLVRGAWGIAPGRPPTAGALAASTPREVLGRGRRSDCPREARSRDGRLYRGRTGVAHLALTAGVPSSRSG